MSPRTTLVLAAIAALLGAFIWLVEIGGEAQRRAAADEEERLHPGLESSAVEAIALTTQDGIEARFERREGRWWLVRPVEAPADAAALDSIAGALVNLRREGSVEDAAGLEQYELGDEARVVRFEVDGETRGLRIGRTTPVGGHRYVSRLADDEVAYVESYRLNPLDRDLADLRDRRIFGFEVGDIAWLQLAWPEGAVELQRRGASGDEEGAGEGEGGRWQMIAPVSEPADDATVRELLTDLSFLRAKGFIDERNERVEAALQERFLELRWKERNRGERAEAAGPVHETFIGGKLGDGRLLSGADGRLYLIASERLEDFERSVVAYRNKTLSRFEVGRARRLQLGLRDEETGTSKTITAVLEGSGWTSDELALDPDAMADLVRELASLRAVDIVADAMGEDELAHLGLAPPRVLIRVEGRSEGGEIWTPLATVELGRLEPDRGIFARRPDRPIVYLLAPELEDTLPLSWADFESGYGVGVEDDALPGLP